MRLANTSTNIKFPAELEPIYNLYGAMLYGIAIEISPTEEEADEVFVDTFIKIHAQMSVDPSGTFSLVQLIKLVIQTSHLYQAQPTSYSKLKLKHPDQLPLMHQLLCQKQSLNFICSDSKLTKVQVGKKLRQEFIRLRNMKTGNSLMWVA